MVSQVVSSDHGFTILVVWDSQSKKCELELFVKGTSTFLWESHSEQNEYAPVRCKRSAVILGRNFLLYEVLTW